MTIEQLTMLIKINEVIVTGLVQINPKNPSKFDYKDYEKVNFAASEA